MLPTGKEILFSSPNIKIRNKQHSFSKNNFTQLPKVLSVKEKLLLKNQLNRITQRREDNKKLISLTIDHQQKNTSSDENFYNYLDSISSDRYSDDEIFKQPSKYRINTEVGQINNKLYNSGNTNNKMDSLVLEKPHYYLNVLNKKKINDLKKCLYNNNKLYQKFINNKTIKTPKRKINNDFEDLNIKDLQKLYYELDNMFLPEISLNKKNGLNNRYKYENYASKKNIFNHPKLYILDGIDKNYQLPKISNKPNTISLHLEYENRKKIERLRIQKLYANYMSNIIKK